MQMASSVSPWCSACSAAASAGGNRGNVVQLLGRSVQLLEPPSIRVERAILSVHDNATAHAELARLEALFSAAVQLHPHASSWSQLGRVRAARGDDTSAERALRNALSLDRSASSEALIALALLREKQGDARGAESMHREAMTMRAAGTS